MQDKIICYHPIMDFITFNDIITDLKIILQDYNTLKDIISTILEDSQFDEEFFSQLLTYDIASSLSYIIDVLQDLL